MTIYVHNFERNLLLTSYSCICFREYFDEVDQTWENFEKTLWGHVANFYKLSKERFVPCFTMKPRELLLIEC
jgi:hypothetical protein